VIIIKKITIIILLILLASLTAAFLIIINQNDDQATTITLENQTQKEVIPIADKKDLLDTPYYLNEHYEVLNDAETLFKLTTATDSFMDALNHFDFEYYSKINKKHDRNFYILYRIDESYFLKQFYFNNDEKFSCDLPKANDYYLITDTTAKFLVEVIEIENIEVLDQDYFNNIISSRKSSGEGGSSNPRKVIINFALSAQDGKLFYDDKIDYPIRSSELYFHIED